MQQAAVSSEPLAAVAAALSDHAAELTGELVRLYERELPDLVHDDESMVSLLSASVYQNMDTAFRVFQHGIDPTRVEAPAAAVEYARRLAQRGTPVINLIRAYYLGQTAMLDHAFVEGARMITEPHALGAAMREALATAFVLIDRITQQVVSAYEEERDNWLLNRSAVRAARVRALLENEHDDIAAGESALGYRLRGTHVGMVVWYSEDTDPRDPLTGLEATACRVAGDRPGAVRPLFVPHDERCAWVWLPVERPHLPGPDDLARALDGDPDVRMALGEPAAGLEGFRRTHRQAVRVQGLALAAGSGAARALTFRDVGAMALMTADLDATRTWVSDTLGALAVDDEQHGRLRETLRVFLAAGASYTAAASRLTMHKNSVQYRVRKAEELLGRPVSDNRLDVELALKLCDCLGAAVLARA